MKALANPIVLALAVAGAAALGLAVGALTIPGGPTEVPPTAPSATAAGSPTPAGPKAQVYVVADGKAPLRVESNYPLIEGTLLTRVASRIDGLRATVTPQGYLNPYATSTVRLQRVTNDEPNVISLWFRVTNDEWGVPAEQARLLLQQLVWTATEEPGIELIRILQNEGRQGGALVAGEPANYEMRRADFP